MKTQSGRLVSTKKKVAILVVEDIHKHCLSDTFDWSVLKEAQDVVIDVNSEEEIQACFKQREHR